MLLATWKGAEVFPNANSTGKADLIIKFNDIVFEVDVKLGRPQSSGYWISDSHKVKAPVYPVMVIPEGDLFTWRVQWILPKGGKSDRRPNCPEGLEDFWS